MLEKAVDVICIQETHLEESEYFQEDGFGIFLSGAGTTVTRSFAGVGLIVSPQVLSAVVCFNCVSDRLAILRVKVAGSMLNFFVSIRPAIGTAIPAAIQVFQ